MSSPQDHNAAAAPTPMKTETGDAPVPVAVVMITANEAHNMESVLANVAGWAQEVHLVDSNSTDDTAAIARRHGVQVVQRAFRGFGDQWNFAVTALPIKAPWTMKLDPDERLTPELKSSIRSAIERGDADGLIVRRRLWFMGRPMPIRQDLLRVWRTGRCKFSDVLVNEHPIVSGRLLTVSGDLEHHDSPDLHHWWDKQNRYTTAEALTMFRGLLLAAEPRLFGTKFQRRMWLKANFHRVPFRYTLLFLHALLVQGAWRGGRVSLIWARLRVEVYRMRDNKLIEMQLRGRAYELPQKIPENADRGVAQRSDGSTA